MDNSSKGLNQGHEEGQGRHQNALAYIGVGLYTLTDAARLLRVRPSTLRNWVNGYTYRTEERTVHQRPVVFRRFDEPLLTFHEFVELLFVKLFREEGVSMQAIRKAAAAASHLFDTPYPLAVKRFDTDGKLLFATLEEEAKGDSKSERIVHELGKGQVMFDSVIRPFFRHLDYRGVAEAIRYWPAEGQRWIVLDPERAFGQPIDAETGVPTRVLYEAYLATQEDATKAARSFEVPLGAVEHSVRFECELLRAA